MPTTAKGIRYPTSASVPNVPQDIQNLASDVDGLLTQSVTSPTSYTSSYGANAVTPLKASKDQNGMVTLSGLMTNTSSIASVAAVWLSLPAGYRPTTPTFWQVVIEGGGIASYVLAADGLITGIGLTVGTYSIPSGRYWSFNHTYQAA